MDSYSWSYAFIAVSAVLALLALLLLLFRWKISFEGQEYSLVPTEVINSNLTALKALEKQVADSSNRLHSTTTKSAESQAKLMQQSLGAVIQHQEDTVRSLVASDEELKERQQRTSDALHAVLTAVKELREETQILRNEIQSQAKELERHRAGYDVDILSASLIPVARMHRMLQSDLARSDLSEDARNTLTVLEDEHLGVLETRGVRLVYPEIGTRYRDQKNVRHPPETEPTTEADLVGTIKSVVHPAYELSTSARNAVLMEAEVVVYSMAQLPNEDSMDTGNSESESKQDG